jgi:hypothetical protein
VSAACEREGSFSDPCVSGTLYSLRPAQVESQTYNSRVMHSQVLDCMTTMIYYSSRFTSLQKRPLHLLEHQIFQLLSASSPSAFRIATAIAILIPCLSASSGLVSAGGFFLTGGSSWLPSYSGRCLARALRKPSRKTGDDFVSCASTSRYDMPRTTIKDMTYSCCTFRLTGCVLRVTMS